jgi:serine/threonine protein kinase
MDFGIVMDIENTSLTRPGMMVGSPSYLSPEQVLGDPITPAADIFLMGITFYEMLTGTRPFKEAEKETVFQRIRETKYIPARKMNSAIPKKLDQIIEKCLRKNPTDRYTDVRSLISDLENYLGPQKSQHTSDIILKYLDHEALLNPSIQYSDLTEEQGMLKKLPWRVVGISVLALLLGIGIGYLIRTPKTTETVIYPSAKPIPSKKSASH